ncbi:MAG: hypothetical protein J0L82_06720 [Deltaproteobacteria bacterium]|nr:hypothetical protein [Deltaproteobacteria bacterium]
MKATYLSVAIAFISVGALTEPSLATPPGWEVRGHTSATLPPETDEIRMITGELEAVDEVVSRCPPRAARCRSSKYSVARLKFTLSCVNDAAVVGSSLTEKPNGKFQLKVSALELSNPRSLVVRCARANVVTVDVPVPTSKAVTLENLEVVFSTRLYLPN